MDQKIGIIVFLVITVVSCNSNAEWHRADSNNATLQSMINFLHESRHNREALSIRNSLLVRKAPPIHVKEWLIKQPYISKWPNGKLTILCFWNTQCGPCIASIPKNNELAEWLTGKGGLFVSIHSTSGERSTILKFADKHPITYAVAIDANSSQVYYSNSKTFKEYGVNGVPTYVTIGKSGRVLSYKRLSIQDLSQLIDNEPNQIDVPQAEAEIRTLAAVPKAWIATGLNPNSKIRNKFLVYRPDTPELILQKTQTSNTKIMVELKRHTEQGQTVYEVVLKGNTPNWGQTIKGEITFAAKYDNGQQLIKIPYQIKSRGLVEYPSSKIHLGLVHKGQKVTRKITMRPSNNQSDIRLKAISISTNVNFKVEDQGANSSDIVLRFIVSFNEIGFHKDVVELLASDHKGNSQQIKLEFSSLVR